MGTLIERVTAFSADFNLTEAHIGREALNDPKFFYMLRRGRSPTLRTVEKLEAWMLDHARSSLDQQRSVIRGEKAKLLLALEDCEKVEASLEGMSETWTPEAGA